VFSTVKENWALAVGFVLCCSSCCVVVGLGLSCKVYWVQVPHLWHLNPMHLTA